MKKILFPFLLFISTITVHSQITDSLEVVTVQEFFFEGNNRTKPWYISREFSFEEGGQYQRRELDSMFVWDRNRIYNTNLFNEIDFSVIDKSDGKVDILVTVQERWYFYPKVLFKLADRNFNDWWVNRGRDLSRVNLGLQLTQYNFRGRGERLRVVAQTGFENWVNFSYDIPYIDKKQKVGLLVQTGYVESKNLVYNTVDNVRAFASSETEKLRRLYRNEIQFSYRPKFYAYHFASIIHRSTHIADTIAQLNPSYFENGATSQKYFRLSYGYTWDKRNNRNYPTNGEWFNFTLSKVGLTKKDDVNFWQAGTSLSKYIDLGKDNYFATNLIGVLSLPAPKSYFNYPTIGLVRHTLRGYDLNVIEGSSYIIHKSEIKRKLFSIEKDISKFMPIKQFPTFPVTMFGKVLFDQGYAKGFSGYTGSDLLDDQYLYSYGVGFDFLLVYDFLVKLEFTRNKLGNNNFFLNFKYTL
ncbi:MAG: BamA/TamA family outer membrane protein [Ekhidna sp.]